MEETQLVPRGPSDIEARSDEPFKGGLVVSEIQIAQTKHSLDILRKMVNEILVEGIDYGLIPGTPEPSLYDPGALQIIAGFNCRVGSARIINQVFTDALIAVVVEVPLISFQTGQEVTCCIGAASTNEVKHKYRWVYKDELADWGYVSDAAIKVLKTKKNKQGEPYSWRIPNPEPTELLNTIWKIAAKRGRVGAAKLLPGVSSALREKFGAKDDDQQPKKKREPSTDWDVFWSDMSKRGLKQDQVHAYLKVKSVKEWVESGKTLKQAVETIDNFLSLEEDAKKDFGIQSQQANQQTTQKPPAKAQAAQPVQHVQPRSEWEKYVQKDIPDYPTLEKVFCKLTPYTIKRLYSELGVSSSRDLNYTPWECFFALKEIFVPEGLPD
jgi:hypothetical protein